MENNSDVKQQLKECLEVLTKILGADLLGVYLYGSYL
ncbi:TPA: adenylyltransferase, partial [Legionella pneumophila]|nr:adenylyltransferase [Legionella pneumophila]HAU3888196.1 adenylyltransferase [Legionella pneumophila]